MIRDVENAIGTQANDAITGSAEANRLEGRGGDDEIFGNDGDDMIVGGAGIDKIAGEGGTDTAILLGELAGASNALPGVVDLADGQATQTAGRLSSSSTGLRRPMARMRSRRSRTCASPGADGLENTADDVVIEGGGCWGFPGQRHRAGAG